MSVIAGCGGGSKKSPGDAGSDGQDARSDGATSVSDGGMPLRYAPDGSVAIMSDPKELRPFDVFGAPRA